MKRVAAVIGLKPEVREEYERIHAAVWPEVLAQIKRSNIRNYSIYRHGDLLFAYYEYVGTDFAGDMAKMAQDAKTQEWWKITDPMQNPLPDRAEGDWWKVLPEVFHTD